MNNAPPIAIGARELEGCYVLVSVVVRNVTICNENL